MKRILLLLLCFALTGALVACAGTGQSPSGDSSGGSDPVGGSNGGTVNGESVGFDASQEHLIIATDIKNQSIVVLDLNKCNGNWENLTNDDCVVWEWVSVEDRNCKIFPSTGLDDAKIRYSDYWDRDVVIASSSNGWAGVIDYEAKTVLWEARVGSGPHSIEMMPNGDLVVACSGNSDWETKGALVYFPLSTGKTTRSDSIFVPSCHGVQYDPTQNVLWVLGYYEVFAVQIDGYDTEDATFRKVDGKLATLEDVGGASGHDLSPVAGKPGTYWVSCGKALWQFDSATCKISKSYAHASSYTSQGIKGIASFPDGVAVETIGGHGENLYASWSTNVLRIITVELTEGDISIPRAVRHNIHFTEREFYKVHAFSKDYQ